MDPRGLREAARAFRLLADYAEAKAQAIAYRMAGQDGKATRLEAQCERIYQQLPADARW
jgi:hypothetical protein